MFIILLCCIFSHSLSLHNLSLQTLFIWFNYHPFLFILAIAEIFEYNITIKEKVGKL